MPRIFSFRNSFFAIAALLLLSPASAFADSASLANGQSATFNYVAVGFPNSTASATFTYNQLAGTLTLVLTNTSTDNIKLTEIGFNANMIVAGTPVITYAGGTLADFVIGTQSLQGTFTLGTNSSGGEDADVLNDGESLTVVFTLSGVPPALLEIGGSQVHLQSLPDGNSQKPNGSITTVPEPASMLLLGTGLAGIASRLRKRRKENNEELS
ncbi:MAG TPA: PEP-CTERM sorting domain-containing protein [Pyrinomonadaceae bacterium]|nr:PEP-CTERM sorting domain-containing protein [Pyrinomonadaceae bacterium]